MAAVQHCVGLSLQVADSVPYPFFNIRLPWQRMDAVAFPGGGGPAIAPSKLAEPPAIAIWRLRQRLRCVPVMADSPCGKRQQKSDCARRIKSAPG
jgi:hypothetical protein